MRNPVVKFSISLLLVLILTFGLHILILYYIELPLFENLIKASYLSNIAMAVGIYLFLYFFRKKFRNEIGFLFMGGSFLKFAVFFLFFYPVYNIDGEITRLEFATFFIPYVACLIMETIGVKSFLQDTSVSA